MRIDGSATRQLANDGSILLVHANGNEPRGIDRLFDWMEENDDWSFRPLWEFIDPPTAMQEGAIDSGP
jgi:hypothetical protein